MGKSDKYAVNKPYPKLAVRGKNLYYASLLQDDYSGYVSEFTAISQYLYHHFYFHHVDEELADILEGTAIVEMHHMEMLAQLIIMLGGDPRIGGYQSTGCQYWSGIFPTYGSDICDRLHADIDAEINAIRIYRYHIQLIEDPCIQDVLERIILDEEHHIKLFKEQYERFCQCKK